MRSERPEWIYFKPTWDFITSERFTLRFASITAYRELERRSDLDFSQCNGAKIPERISGEKLDKMFAEIGKVFDLLLFAHIATRPIFLSYERSGSSRHEVVSPIVANRSEFMSEVSEDHGNNGMESGARRHLWNLIAWAGSSKVHP